MKTPSAADQHLAALHVTPRAMHHRVCSATQLKGILCAVLAGLATFVQAQSYSIDWFTIDAGGGISTGGAYSLSGTIGQPDAGLMTGGSYTLQGGFWGVIAAVVTDTNAPSLLITRTSESTVVVSWVRPADGWVLENTTALGEASWSQVTAAYQTNSSTISVPFTLSPPTDSRFFRLKKP